MGKGPNRCVGKSGSVIDSRGCKKGIEGTLKKSYYFQIVFD